MFEEDKIKIFNNLLKNSGDLIPTFTEEMAEKARQEIRQAILKSQEENNKSVTS